MFRMIASLFVLGMLLVPVGTEACTCAPSGPPCTAYWEVAAVFAGRVESVSSGTENRIGGSRVVRFAVLESFRGMSSSTVDIRTGRGSGDCGYRFTEGVEYFVYAYRQDGILSTNICTRTRPIEDAGADLAYARAIADPDPPPGRISGQVMLHHRRLGGGSVSPPEPLAGITVLLEREGQSLRGVTDRYGTFEFLEPAPATYTLRLDLPDRYHAGHIPAVRLSDGRACADLSIAVYYDGRVLGRVLDAQGTPIGGLTLELVSAERPLRGPQLDRLRALTRADGRYEFSRVPPGRFVLGVNAGLPPDAPSTEPRVLHPGRFALEAGARMAVPDFVMPPSVRYVPLTGVVLDPDGFFAAGARVYLAGPGGGDALLGEPAVTDSSGRFMLAAIEGREYRLLAYRKSGVASGSRVDSTDPVLLKISTALRPLRLSLRARH